VLQKLVGLIRQELAYAQRARIRRVVTMYEHDRCALRGGVLIGLLLVVPFRADRMVENDHAFGANLSADEFGSLAVEPLADRAIVVPLLKRRAKIT